MWSNPVRTDPVVDQPNFGLIQYVSDKSDGLICYVDKLWGLIERQFFLKKIISYWIMVWKFKYYVGGLVPFYPYFGNFDIGHCPIADFTDV
jgi:hypothetical protein